MKVAKVAVVALVIAVLVVGGYYYKAWSCEGAKHHTACMLTR